MKRVSLDLLDHEKERLEKLSEETGLTVNNLLRMSLQFVALYRRAKSQGKELMIVDPANPNEKSQIEMLMPS